ncbi:MAG: heavy metal-binding domain-containing protein, partial [Bacteroidetes bacterium]|nr:heavy metal-binding domain-containing protein [Bacteroidota bacterium]
MKYQINQTNIIIATAFSIVGVFMGWLFFGGNSSIKEAADGEHNHAVDEIGHWTCSMHPQISLGKPGQCPICGMDLIPITTGEEDDEGPTIITMSEAAMRIAEVETSVIEKIIPFKEVYLSGKVKADERRIT